jgi:phospholipid/cholesterol/gamma-HCH transport system ATP-binding protein
MSIRLTDLHKAFDGKVVLNGVSLEIRNGETIALIGQSGSGKSVLLKTIVRLLEPDSGSVEVDDLDVLKLEREELYQLRRRVGYVFQFAALFDSMTVFDNIAMGLRRMKTQEESQIRERVEKCLRLVEMEGYGDRLPAQLSGGQRKRIGLARAIATQPEYLLYDEPTTGLDPITTAVIDELMQRLASELNVTSVVVTHDMRSAARIADRIALLHDGRIQFEGTPEEVRTSSDPIVRAFVEGLPHRTQEAVS